MAIEDNEYQYLLARLKALRAIIEQARAEYANLVDSISGKVDVTTFQRVNLIYESRFEGVEALLSNSEQFASTAFLISRANHTGDENIDANAIIGGASDTVGFYGDEGDEFVAVNALDSATAGGTYTATEQAMLQDTFDKLTELISVLKAKNLL